MCGTENEDGVKFCKSCGATFDDSEESYGYQNQNLDSNNDVYNNSSFNYQSTGYGNASGYENTTGSSDNNADVNSYDSNINSYNDQINNDYNYNNSSNYDNQQNNENLNLNKDSNANNYNSYDANTYYPIQNDGYNNNNYAYQNGNQYNSYNQVQNEDQTMGIASLICGLVGFFCCGVILGPAAIILGILQLKKQSGKGLAIAGIVTGAISTLLYVVMIIIYVIAIAAEM